jgi:hypothetical protein
VIETSEHAEWTIQWKIESNKTVKNNIRIKDLIINRTTSHMTISEGLRCSIDTQQDGANQITSSFKYDKRGIEHDRTEKDAKILELNFAA